MAAKELVELSTHGEQPRHLWRIVAAVITWCGVLAFEWMRAPNCTPLLGPLFIVWYNGWDAFTWVSTVGLSIGVLGISIRINNPTICLFTVSAGLWLILGMLGQGIGC